MASDNQYAPTARSMWMWETVGGSVPIGLEQIREEKEKIRVEKEKIYFEKKKKKHEEK